MSMAWSNSKEWWKSTGRTGQPMSGHQEHMCFCLFDPHNDTCFDSVSLAMNQTHWNLQPTPSWSPVSIMRTILVGNDGQTNAGRGFSCSYFVRRPMHVAVDPNRHMPITSVDHVQKDAWFMQ
ncbi:MAG: hypothetical protein BYD32DRAFT_406217 [Podila humilis]|nr:MAG: hypothetical protein BYD32DRAFT_406217 [Podila humilis]